jgi:hypothetical protein
MLFNNAATIRDYAASLMYEWISMDNQWNDIDRRKSMYADKNMCHCHFIHNNSHLGWSGIEPGPPQWESGN